MAHNNKTSESNQVESVKLSHGQFVVRDRLPENVVVERLINPLTQEELADGWRMVLPRSSKTRPVHHHSVYLSQLPEHLWRYLKLYTNSDGVEQFRVLRDKIYHYSVRRTSYDRLLLELYREVTRQDRYPNPERVRGLLNNSDLQNYKHGGWLMLRAKKMC